MAGQKYNFICRLLWWCFASSLWLYWMIAFFFAKEPSLPAYGNIGFLKWVFLLASVIPIAVIAYIKRLVYEKRIKLSPNYTSYPDLRRNAVIVSFAFSETPAILNSPFS